MPAAATALLALPAILLLYFLKVRRPEVTVATLLFWRPRVADRQANAPWQRLRFSLLLLLQLLAAAALALALMRPGVAGVAGVGQVTVVLVDGSASMRATDVTPSRFEVAIEDAKRMAGQLRPGQQMATVLLGEHAQLLTAATDDPALLRAGLDRARPAGQAADLGEGLSLADALLAGREGGAIVLISDGHARAASPLRAAAPVTYIGVGSSGENAGIESLTRTADGNVFLRVANYGRQALSTRVEMRADGVLVDVLPMEVDGGSAGQLTWTRLPAGTRVLEARLTPGDSFALDDVAWLVTADPPVHSVLLVTPGNGFMARALSLVPGVKLTIVEPGKYRPGAYDLYVFDSFLPPGPLPQPALVMNPPEGEGPVAAGPQVDPGGVLPASPLEPLLQDVVLRDVHVQAAARVEAPPDWRTVIAGTSDALLLVHQGEPRLAELTFDIHHSDLPLRPAFPILVHNLVTYLLPGGFENQAYPLDDPVRLVAQPDARALEVTTPEGHTIDLAPPFPAPPLTDTSSPGVYTVRERLPSGDRTSYFTVSLQDPGESRIAPGAPPAVQVSGAGHGVVARGTLEIWPWIAAAALVLIFAEWLVFLRA